MRSRWKLPSTAARRSNFATRVVAGCCTSFDIAQRGASKGETHGCHPESPMESQPFCQGTWRGLLELSWTFMVEHGWTSRIFKCFSPTPVAIANGSEVKERHLGHTYIYLYRCENVFCIDTHVIYLQYIPIYSGSDSSSWQCSRCAWLASLDA